MSIFFKGSNYLQFKQIICFTHSFAFSPTKCNHVAGVSLQLGGGEFQLECDVSVHPLLFVIGVFVDHFG